MARLKRAMTDKYSIRPAQTRVQDQAPRPPRGFDECCFLDGVRVDDLVFAALDLDEKLGHTFFEITKHG